MAHETNNEYDMFKERFLRLPRELRDLVYANVYDNSAPVPMEHIDSDPAILILFETNGHEVDPEYRAEILEAFYTHSTFVVTFLDPQHQTREDWHVQWSPYPQYHKYIRNLEIHAQESNLGPTVDLENIEHDCLGGLGLRRSYWERLLELPRLEKLTIRLQKRHNSHFVWADFSPVLIQLRERLPNIQIAFYVSFDTLLERYWSDPIWENNTEPGNEVELPYDPMGFVNVTELVEAPTEEDVKYVQENCPELKDASGRDILIGLLDEFAPQRRALALHYVVKEPAFLRVRMMEHYELYKDWKASRAKVDVNCARMLPMDCGDVADEQAGCAM